MLLLTHTNITYPCQPHSYYEVHNKIPGGSAHIVLLLSTESRAEGIVSTTEGCVLGFGINCNRSHQHIMHKTQ